MSIDDLKRYQGDHEFTSAFDSFYIAASNRKWNECARLRFYIESRWPGALKRNFVKICSGNSGIHYSKGNIPKGGRHRWLFFDMYGEERCMKCGCQRPK